MAHHHGHTTNPPRAIPSHTHRHRENDSTLLMILNLSLQLFAFLLELFCFPFSCFRNCFRRERQVDNYQGQRAVVGSTTYTNISASLDGDQSHQHYHSRPNRDNIGSHVHHHGQIFSQEVNEEDKDTHHHQRPDTHHRHI